MKKTLLFALLSLLNLTPCIFAAEPASKVEVLRNDTYPHAFFFRQAGGFARQGKISYPKWDATFAKLQGITGKLVGEELGNGFLNTRNYFQRFKKEHPEQLVLWHYNGNARDPRWRREKFFPGHWLYHDGSLVTAPAGPSDTTLKVANPTLYKVDTGRYRNTNEDLALLFSDKKGKIDWQRTEYVRLVSVDKKGKSVVVERGCYGTQAQPIRQGEKVTLAALVTEGPWGKRNHLLWFHNFSLDCPRDAQGKNCGDILAAELAALMQPGGELAFVDGLQFDVLFHTINKRDPRRGIDSNGDLVADAGLTGKTGINRYGAGVIAFCEKLRKLTPPEKLLLADGATARHQRALLSLSGIESEGWPELRDPEVKEWSGGLNRHFFWQQFAAKPKFSYVNHKFISRGEKPGEKYFTPIPFATHRLVMAATVLTDSAFCYAFPPPKEEDGTPLGVWDELWCGKEQKKGWLGKPLGKVVRMGTEAKPLFSWATSEANPKLPQPLEVKTEGSDLLVEVTATTSPSPGMPPGTPRLLWCACGEERPQMSWAGEKPFTSYFYFNDVKQAKVKIKFTVEGGQAPRLEGVRIFAKPDVIYRQFSGGLVLANPSQAPVKIDLAKRFPGIAYARIPGTPLQDPKTNNGKRVGNILVLPPRDALFLRTLKPTNK